VLAAYRSGIFPWPDSRDRLLWWSPEPRAILPLDRFHESRSLRRTRRRGVFRVTRDHACEQVVRHCAERPEGTWITPRMIAAYVELHHLGWVHSIEVWCGETLAGGLYGVTVGGVFAAESMFHRVRDASKVAVASLVEHLSDSGFALLDVQLQTDHLSSLGAVEIARDEYLDRVKRALRISASF
jgi:leucyl/phenylalanyl-tRNA--protein transferase